MTRDGAARAPHARRLTSKAWRLWPAMSVALLGCLGCGLASVAFGPDNNWDLRYYHLYAPWAYLHHRYLFDIGPAQYQGFFNPTADLLFYGLVTSPLNGYPRAVAFVMGAVHGLNVGLIYAIARHVLRPARAAEHSVLAFAALALGITGAGFVSLLGTTTNDLITSIFILGALLALLKTADLESGTATLPGFGVAGLLLGLGVGLKFTTAVFAPGLGLIAIIAAIRRRSLLGLFTCGSACMVGFVAAAGHHMLTLWQLFANPVFPLFNALFQSPYYELENLRDTQYLRGGLGYVLSLPFRWAQTNSDLVSELTFRDWRGALAATAMIACAVQLSARRLAHWQGDSPQRAETRGLRFVCLFVVLSFLAWAFGFAIYRYAVTLEMLSGVVAIGALLRLVADTRIRIALAITTVAVVVATTIPFDWGRGEHPSQGIRPAHFSQKYIDVSVPPLPPDSVVLIATWDPASYFIPFADPSAQYVGIENNYLTTAQNNGLARAVKQLMRASGRPKFIVSVGAFDAARLNEQLQAFDLVLSGAPCLPIRSNLEEHRLSLCPATTR